MTRIETDHLRLTRFLLLAIGVWPYDRSLLTRVQCASLFAILITSIIFQLTALLTPECTISLAIKILSCAASFGVFALKYISFMIHSCTVRYLLEYLNNIRNNLKDENEIAIMKHYGSMTARYATGLTLLAAFGMFLSITILMWPSLLDFALHINESQRVTRLPFVTYYFVEEEKYYYLILLHLAAGICIGLTALVGTGTMIIAYFKHACGIICVARYRIQQAINESKTISLESTPAICKRIASAVDFHRKGLEYCIVLMSNFEGSFFILITLLMIGLSLNFFSLFQTVVNGYDIEEFGVQCVCALPLFLYVMLSNYSTQEVTDHNNDLFVTVYNVQWYKAPLQIQKMILFLLQRGNKSFIMVLGGIYAASIESAGKLISTSVSYFTVLYSSQ